MDKIDKIRKSILNSAKRTREKELDSKNNNPDFDIKKLKKLPKEGVFLIGITFIFMVCCFIMAIKIF